MSKKIGIGIDIELVEKFRKMSLVENHPFVKKYFSKIEIDYCFIQNDPIQHLCARFAVKEATIKALAEFNFMISNKIWIQNNDIGIPHLFLDKTLFEEKTRRLITDFTFHVSLTHNELIGAAIVLIESKTLQP